MLEAISIDQLRTLRAVAEAGSFTAAARQLGRVQAAVSQSIQRLEAQLQLKLFDRTGRVPVLTEHGAALVAAAEQIHADFEAVEAVVARLQRGEETRLSLVVDAMFPSAALVGFAREFAAAHPGVELTIATEMLDAVTAMVRERRATLGIAGIDADLRGLEQRQLADLKMIAVAAPSHPLAAIVGPIDDAALGSAVQIVLSERAADGRGSANRGVLSARTWRVADLSTKHALIVGGLGWGHEPEHLVREAMGRGELVALNLAAWGDAPPLRQLTLVRRKRSPLGPVAGWAVDRLTDLCRLALRGSTAAA
ncbi:LysR family transcriptional regulator [Nannocystis bainbridge]|uniref:LysR family transcriptional regulator n=1 Tax=Nannocystis bainbridge TaxID=2995303 RepID=A0ABT5DVG1_9BACT|nr:LysR family transcriptional regulator [Nannocystis bainbridge]MDC0717625.1 LysR family transcriptional regulator [Nannocystis bainbridge]